MESTQNSSRKVKKAKTKASKVRAAAKNQIQTVKNQIEEPLDTLRSNDKINKAIDWVKANPKKSIGMGILGLFALRSRATRKILMWTATTAGTMMFKDEIKDSLEKSIKSDSTSETYNIEGSVSHH